MSFEQTIIFGNVGRDPEMRYTKDGKAVASFSVAVNQGKDRDAKWFRVTCWERLAEVVAKYVCKGMPVLAVGYINASAWIDKGGQALASLELTAVKVQFGAAATSTGDTGDREYGPADEYAPPPQDVNDIPF